MTIIIITILIIAVLSALSICLPILLKKFNSNLKGSLGENKVAHVLGDTVAGNQYVINDIIFYDKNGHTCQIDHILINNNGIWVIETKNYSGKIYGNNFQQEWTQVLAYGRTKNKFYNPVKQNAAHIFHLSEYLKVKNIFHNVVVFLNDADISKVNSENVCSIKQLNYIKNQTTDVFLLVEEMKIYYNEIMTLKFEGETISKKEHIANIRETQNKLKQNVCPRCGSQLVLRKGKTAQFYGCSNYPKCRFTKNLNY